MLIKIKNIPQNLDQFYNLLNIIKNKELESYISMYDLKLDYFKIFLYFISEYENIKENYDFLSAFRNFINNSISKFIKPDNKIECDDVFNILSDFDIFFGSYVVKGVEFEGLRNEIFNCLNENIEIKGYFLNN